MASSPRARGADFELYALTESVTYGTAPGGNYVKLPCYSFELGATADVQADPILSATAENIRDPTGGYLGRQSVAGNAVVPVDLENFGAWLHMLFGTATTSGTTDYTHTWDSGSNTLPSKAFEKAMPRITKYAMMTGVMANTLALTWNTEQNPRATIGLMGQDETVTGTTGAGTPTFAGMTLFRQKQFSLLDNGSAFANVLSFSLDYSNNLEPYYDINSGGFPTVIDASEASLSGTAQVRVSPDAMTLIDDAVAETTHAFTLAATISATKSITFTMPRCLLSRPTIGVTGPSGIDVSFKLTAQYDATAGYMLRTVLKNQTVNYL